MGPLLIPYHLLVEFRRRARVLFARMSTKCLSSWESCFTVLAFVPFFQCFSMEVGPNCNLVPDLKFYGEIITVPYISRGWRERLRYAEVRLGLNCNHYLSIDTYFKNRIHMGFWGFGVFFASSLFKSVKIYVIPMMGRNFDDYPYEKHST